jgi:hypothetical protein
MSNFETRKWTEEELEYLYKERMLGTPYKVIAEKLDRTVKALENKYNRDTDWTSYSFYNQEEVDAKREEIETGAVKQQVFVNKALDKFRLSADIIGDKITQAARNLPAVPPPLYTPTPKTSKADEHMVLVLSDLHIGHEHTLEETGGLSEYNVDIFIQRLENLKQAITNIYELHSSLYRIPKLHIMSLGDIVDGANTAGAWSPVWINTPIMDQISLGCYHISNFVHYMLSIFQEVEFYAIYGNHGRIAQSGAEKKYANFDYICYKNLEQEFRNEPRLKIHSTKSWWMIKEIQKHKFLMIHGDDVKSKDPPVKGVFELEKRMAGLTKIIPDYTIAGHFHNASEFTTHSGKAIVNGSFVGGDVYSLSNNMPGNLPEQKLFGVHPGHGITWTYNVNLKYNRD